MMARKSTKQVLIFALIIFSIVLALVKPPVNLSEAAVDRKSGHSECISCHGTDDPDPGAMLFPADFDPSQACLGCHKYAQRHHPVNFEPARALSGEYEQNILPLYDGQIKCLTCHQIHQESPAPKLLRGGPYTDRRQICFKCHYSEQYSGLNPHVMLDRSGEIKELNGEPVCLFCHRTMPVQNGVSRRVNFRADVAFLCWRCHPPMPDEFFNRHFMAKPSRKTLETMKLSEIERDVAFPLLNRGKVTCSTCHNPHQKGVILDGPARAGEDEHDRLRLPPDKICRGCHAIE